jgi:hypothetical protein
MLLRVIIRQISRVHIEIKHLLVRLDAVIP